jgi:molybdenum cofactor cytidylyltransferase
MIGTLPKLLLHMPDGRSILSHAAANALALGPLCVVVVVRPDLPALLESLDGLPVMSVPNPRYAEGMGTSLAAGVAALPDDAQAVLVLLGDEPDVSHDIVRRLVESYLSSKAAITVPMYGGQVGPPTLFSRELFADLAALQGDVGGRQLFALYPDRVCRVPFANDERPKDIDTPEDLARLYA